MTPRPTGTPTDGPPRRQALVSGSRLSVVTVSFTDDDEGKVVVDASENTLGVVTDVEGDTAYVDPDPSLAETVKADMGLADTESDEYTVKEGAVETKAEEKLHLRGNL